MSSTSIKKIRFGSAYASAIFLYTLQSETLTIRIINYGGIIVSVEAPDRQGRFEDVVLGFDRLDPYISNPAYFGAIIGRYANRIADARFALHGREYRLARNDGKNSLHGGLRGFDKRCWTAQEIEDGISLTYTSPDQEEGYPGNLEAQVSYTVASNELRISYSAGTDRDTVVNLTNHSYFNLAGHASGDILAHELQLESDFFTPCDKDQIPTAALQPVEGTAFDFRQQRLVGERIMERNEQLRIGQGYDHNWVLRSQVSGLRLAARLRDPKSGRALEVLTTEPGIQFYSGNLLDGTLVGKHGARYRKHAALCLETQHFPNSPNTPQFPSTKLKTDDHFESQTVYRFLTT
ncbi:MAG: aldose epimerase family protein [Terriglobales bacterium]